MDDKRYNYASCTFCTSAKKPGLFDVILYGRQAYITAEQLHIKKYDLRGNPPCYASALASSINKKLKQKGLLKKPPQ